MVSRQWGGGSGVAKRESGENGEVWKDVDDLLRFCSLGFERQNLGRAAKEMEKINGHREGQSSLLTFFLPGVSTGFLATE